MGIASVAKKIVHAASRAMIIWICVALTVTSSADKPENTDAAFSDMDAGRGMTKPMRMKSARPTASHLKLVVLEKPPEEFCSWSAIAN